MTHPGAMALAALLLLPPAAARGGGEPCTPACSSLHCQLRAARCLLRSGQVRPAKTLLRSLQPDHPTSMPLCLLLCRAYLALDNPVWAQRVLVQALQHRPRSCQLRAWLVWVHLRRAELEQARQLLDEPGCPGRAAAMRGRWQLLRATLARHGERSAAARAALRRASRSRALWAEDHRLLRWLRQQLGLTRPPPLLLRAELGGGYTTNGLMSSPVDLASGSQSSTGSPALTLDLLARLQPPWGRWLRPVLEGSLRGLLLTDGALRDYSTLDMALRPGLQLGPLQLAYSGQLFLLGGGDRYAPDGPRLFYESHRGELEWSAAPWATLWLGAGRTLFRERSRSRTELDGGAGLGATLWRLHLVGALSLRAQWAARPAYHRFGGTALAAATLPLGRFTLKSRLLLSLDHYPDSAGFFDPRRDRRDLLLKGGAEAWVRLWHGSQLGLTYEPATRFSTAELYRYTDHRVLARLRWQLSLDPWAPDEQRPAAAHVALPYGVGQGANGAQDQQRIRDLLRQEDAAQRGSTCID